MLIIRYPDESKAKSATDSFRSHFLDKPIQHDFLQYKNEKWMGISLMKNYFAAVFDAPSRQGAIELMDAVRSNL